jgi:hypothetical protein
MWISKLLSCLVHWLSVYIILVFSIVIFNVPQWTKSHFSLKHTWCTCTVAVTKNTFDTLCLVIDNAKSKYFVPTTIWLIQISFIWSAYTVFFCIKNRNFRFIKMY